MAYGIAALNANHIEAAAGLAMAAYREERAATPILPDENYFDQFGNMLARMLDDRLGVVALDGHAVVGFITCLTPWANHFGTSLGTFCPVQAHGAIAEDRQYLSALLYQHAAAKWVAQGIYSHAIAVYGHDAATRHAFFWNGFGMRTVEAIRSTEPMAQTGSGDAVFSEIPATQLHQVVSFKNLLEAALQASPIFIPCFADYDAASLEAEAERRHSRYFVARWRDVPIGFLEIASQGVNFVGRSSGMINIRGAYIVPAYRGTGVFGQMLAWLMARLREEGYTRCGVDYEAFNPRARGGWRKYFTDYAHGLARRIDERISRRPADIPAG